MRTKFQSTPPRGGRPPVPQGLRGANQVSIHAPAWGATSRTPRSTRCEPSFNPRPRVGGDLPYPKVYAVRTKFQSTPPRGGRPPVPQGLRGANQVSIHAPAWGATSRTPRSTRCEPSFNPRPRVGGDLPYPKVYAVRTKFQSTPPRGGRPPVPQGLRGANQVSIHAPAWGATSRTPRSTRCEPSFNPRPRVGGDLPYPKVYAVRTKFQSTPPRGGRPPVPQGLRGANQVSIHAPAWGATSRTPRSTRCEPSFNPRPRVGGDLPYPKVYAVRTKFQSTPPRGGRPPVPQGLRGANQVSIHAPAWGATSRTPRSTRCEPSFNPRPRVGGDLPYPKVYAVRTKFQSTPPRGGRPPVPQGLRGANQVSIHAPAWGATSRTPRSTRCEPSFNPRPRVGGDLPYPKVYAVRTKFQSTPPRGGRPPVPQGLRGANQVSIHAPAWGATSRTPRSTRCEPSFNPRPRVGGDLPYPKVYAVRTKFQSTPPRGGRPPVPQGLRGANQVSIHAPAWGATSRTPRSTRCEPSFNPRPRVGGDLPYPKVYAVRTKFQSTPPRGGRPPVPQGLRGANQVSIHAPAWGATSRTPRSTRCEPSFNPRPRVGGDLPYPKVYAVRTKFQSTPPRGGRPPVPQGLRGANQVSIHAPAWGATSRTPRSTRCEPSFNPRPRVGGDLPYPKVYAVRTKFQSTPPRGGRPPVPQGLRGANQVSIHAPAWGATSRTPRSTRCEPSFNPRPRVGGDLPYPKVYAVRTKFQSTPPRGGRPPVPQGLRGANQVSIHAPAWGATSRTPRSTRCEPSFNPRPRVGGDLPYPKVYAVRTKFQSTPPRGGRPPVPQGLRGANQVSIHAPAWGATSRTPRSTRCEPSFNPRPRVGGDLPYPKVYAVRTKFQSTPPRGGRPPVPQGLRGANQVSIHAPAWGATSRTPRSTRCEPSFNPRPRVGGDLPYPKVYAVRTKFQSTPPRGGRPPVPQGLRGANQVSIHAPAWGATSRTPRSTRCEPSFNPRPRVGGDLPYPKVYAVRTKFQSTPPRGGRPPVPQGLRGANQVSIHAPAWGATSRTPRSTRCEPSFNPRPRVGGDLPYPKVYAVRTKFQSTPPRGGRPPVPQGLRGANQVSIHAPAWGATSRTPRSTRCEPSFNPRPRVGGDLPYPKVYAVRTKFQSTPPRGGRPPVPQGLRGANQVSIHAPAWGATSRTPRSTRCEPSFNPRPRVGGDLPYPKVYAVRTKFQSTPPRGGRPPVPQGLRGANQVSIHAPAWGATSRTPRSTRCEPSFNPRPRVGGDLPYPKVYAVRTKFQSTPPRGGRPPVPQGLRGANQVSIHAPAWGATSRTPRSTRCEPSFNPRPRVGGDLPYPKVYAVRTKFQSTPPRGGRPPVPQGLRGANQVSIHAPAWGATSRTPRSTRCEPSFNPRPRVGGDLPYPKVYAVRTKFQSTPPRGGRPPVPQGLRGANQVSIHAPAWGATSRTPRSTRCEPSFNPRPRVGGDLPYPKVYAVRTKFQSTPPRGGRPPVPQGLRGANQVSIHAPAWGATSRTPRSTRCEPSFNPRPRVGGDLPYPKVYAVRTKFQSTPPRGGRPPVPQGLRGANQVSIHAPAWGATSRTPRSTRCEPSFNPRPRVGGDLPYPKVYAVRTKFQSTPPRGGRPPVPQGLRGANQVSIHAPAWGATSRTPRSTRCEPSFNPRPRVGGDLPYPKVYAVRTKFQSTPPRGGRPPVPQGLRGANQVSIHAPAWGATSRTPRSTRCEPSFNPRPRVGGDLPYPKVYAVRTKFQSTPPRGGRPPVPQGLRGANQVSIHAPAWGATSRTPRSTRCEPSFNPRPRVGGDLPYPKVYAVRTKFQSTPPRGGRPPVPQGLRGANQVSIHAPAWGATSRTPRSTRCEPSFNPRPRVGGDLPYPKVYAVRTKFQSTPPRGGRPPVPQGLRGANQVSIHAPAWGATRLRERSNVPNRRFNPRPRVGGDLAQVRGLSFQLVSIHAPAWGATLSRLPVPSTGEVSIHAPAWGATTM